MLNIFSLAAVFLPITAAFLWRMHVEEAALKQASVIAINRARQQTPRC